MSKAIGYLALDEDRRPLHHAAHRDRLYNSGTRHPATLFKTRRTALRAIERTRDFAVGNDLDHIWKTWKWSVLAVRPYESPFGGQS